MNTKIFILPRWCGIHLRPILILLGLMVLLTGCATVQVSQDYDPSYPFGSATTFASTFNWNEKQQRENDYRLRHDQLLANRFRAAIEAALTRQGFRLNAQPALLVSYTYEVYTRLETDYVNSGFGFGYGRYGRHGIVGFDTGTVIRQYDQGKLVIDIHSANTGKLLWKGTGTREVFTHSNPDQLTRRVTEMVDAVLAQFPPVRQ